jgi:5-oxoprolinase (ATP-hydrolysing) subunit A
MTGASERERLSIDLNADLGEGAGTERLAEDEKLLSLVSSANIACGYHSGDAVTIRDTVRIAHERGVSIGAHPSFPDKLGFGRREMKISGVELEGHVVRQIEILAGACAIAGATLRYVKPHGALYNLAARDRRTADVIASAIVAVDTRLVFLGLAGNEMLAAASDAGLATAAEAFADRGYADDATLIPRGENGDLLDDPEKIAERAIRLVTRNTLTSRDGKTLAIRADSLCTHGDGPNAFAILHRLRADLESAGISIAPFVS